MKNGERILWLAIVVLTLSAAFWMHIRTERAAGDESSADHPAATSIQARCGVAAGRNLASKEVTITCGLDEPGIEAIIARAIRDLNIDELAAQAREGLQALSHDADEMALRLGMTREALMQLLAGLSAPKSGETISPEQLASAMTRGGNSLPIVVIATVLKPELEPDTLARTASPHTSISPATARQEPDKPTHRERAILEESARLHVECGIVVGTDVSVGSTRIRCGPKKEEIGAIIQRLLNQSDVNDLVGDLRRGTLAHQELLDSLQDELDLSRTTLLQLLKQVADANIAPGQAAIELQQLTERHIAATYQLGNLPRDDEGADRLRALVAAAIGSGEFETAETLMSQWREFKRSEENLKSVEAELAALRDRDAVETDDSSDRAEEPESASQTPVATLSGTADSGAELQEGERFVSPDRAVLDVPASTPAGAVMQFPWRGPAAPEDLIFIAETDLAESKYPVSKERRHDDCELRKRNVAHGAIT